MSAKPPADKPPEQVLAEAPLDVLMEALAKISGQIQGKTGEELRAHVDDVKGQTASLIGKLELDEFDHEAKQGVAAEVDKLLATVSASHTLAGDAIAKHRSKISDAFRGVELEKMAEGLQLLAAWLRDPTNERAADAQTLIAQLQEAMGTMVGYDPERDEAARRAEIKKDVQASLDNIFRGTPKKA